MTFIITWNCLLLSYVLSLSPTRKYQGQAHRGEERELYIKLFSDKLLENNINIKLDSNLSFFHSFIFTLRDIILQDTRPFESLFSLAIRSQLKWPLDIYRCSIVFIVLGLPKKPSKATTEHRVGLWKNEFSYSCSADGEQASSHFSLSHYL